MNGDLSAAARTHRGARNLLCQCVKSQPGERVIIVAEDPSLGHYDSEMPHLVARAAARLGCHVEIIRSGLGSRPEVYMKELGGALESADHVIFLSRIGDQVRFSELSGTASHTMVYTLDQAFLGSAFGTLSHRFMCAVRASFETRLMESTSWRITCPLGTDLSGSCIADRNSSLEFSVKLFPVATFRPVPCGDAEGRVAVAHWLMGTDTHAYEGEFLTLEEPVFALIAQGQVRDYEGPAAIVSKVRAHYRRVAELFGVDGSRVGSWHAGIHPKTFYPRKAQENLRRWGSVAFASPRYLHFHTCGADPGEIAWSIFDPTVELDGRTYYDSGRFVYLDAPDVQELCRTYGLDRTALTMVRDIGID